MRGDYEVMNLETIKLNLEGEISNSKTAITKDIYIIHTLLNNTPNDYDKIFYFTVKDRTIEFVGDYQICLEYNKGDVSKFYSNLPLNFTKDITIYEKDKKIGKLSFSRIFMNYTQDIINEWELNESINIIKHICKNDFSKVEGRFVGLLNEFELYVDINDKYKNLPKYIFFITNIFIQYINSKLNIYSLYTDCKMKINGETSNSTELAKIYQKLEYQEVDNFNHIYSKDIWHKDMFRNMFAMNIFQDNLN